MSETVNERGIFASLRRLLATALDIAQVRLELLSTEIELEKRRVFDGLLWGALALLVVGLGLVMLCGFVILLFWDGYRLPAVGVLAVLFLAGGAILVQKARQRLRTPDGMLATNIDELKRDREALTTMDSHGK
jgi:uncharacterized membrane protein YqjE